MILCYCSEWHLLSNISLNFANWQMFNDWKTGFVNYVRSGIFSLMQGGLKKRREHVRKLAWIWKRKMSQAIGWELQCETKEKTTVEDLRRISTAKTENCIKKWKWRKVISISAVTGQDSIVTNKNSLTWWFCGFKIFFSEFSEMSVQLNFSLSILTQFCYNFTANRSLILVHIRWFFLAKKKVFL